MTNLVSRHDGRLYNTWSAKYGIDAMPGDPHIDLEAEPVHERCVATFTEHQCAYVEGHEGLHRAIPEWTNTNDLYWGDGSSLCVEVDRMERHGWLPIVLATARRGES